MLTAHAFKLSHLSCASLTLALGLLAFVPWLGSFGVLDPTDSFFLESAREMVETGKYLLPLSNYEPWLDKPILFFWLVCGAYKLFGIAPFFGRLPAALSGALTAVCIYWGCRDLIPKRTAFLASLIFLSLPLVSIGSHICLTDTTLTLLVAATTLFFWRGLQFADNKKINWDLLIGYTACGLGMLCKGPIAPILSTITIVPALLLGTRSIPQTLEAGKKLISVAGILLFALICVPWYVLAGIETQGEFLKKFFIEQNFGRMVGTVNHQAPWYFYIPIFFGGFAPWCVLPILSFSTIRRAVLRPGISGLSGMLKLSLCWFVFVVGMFTSIKTKLPWYILPACPGFAIMIAIQIEYLVRAVKSRAILIMQGAGLVALVVAFLVQNKFPSYAKGIVTTFWPVLVIILLWLVASFLCLAFVKKKISKPTNIRLAAISIVGIMILGCSAFIPGSMRAMYNHKQVGFNRLVCLTRIDDSEVAIMMAEEPTMNYILHKPVHRLANSQECMSFTQLHSQHRFILVPKEMLPDLKWFQNTPLKLLANEGKWSLFAVQSDASKNEISQPRKSP